MVSLEINDAVVLEQQQILEKALSTNPKTQKALQKLIREAIMGARADVVNSIKFANGDPRQSRRAVRTAVYKKILGANINIYNSRRGGSAGTISYERPRTLRPGQRGGNRMKLDTKSRSYIIQHYEPNKRGFILRFVNSGTEGRYAGHGRNGRTEEERQKFILNTGGRGWRGQIAPRNFFKGAAERALVKAVDVLANLIDTELENILNKK